jgi:hypothetical protein
MLSKRDTQFGRGPQVAPDTFIRGSDTHGFTARPTSRGSSASIRKLGWTNPVLVRTVFGAQREDDSWLLNVAQQAPHNVRYGEPF